MNQFFCRMKPLIYLALACTCISFVGGVSAKAPADTGHAKTSESKGVSKSANDKDIVLGKNSENTLYLLAGWGKAEGPYIWYTVSARFNR